MLHVIIYLHLETNKPLIEYKKIKNKLWYREKTTTRVHPIVIDHFILTILPFFSNNFRYNFTTCLLCNPPLNICQNRLAALQKAKASLIVEWDTEYSKLSYYLYTTSTSPQLFLKMSCFITGRISQMHAYKSYLTAHSS
jgi:hypothetical protein